MKAMLVAGLLLVCCSALRAQGLSSWQLADPSTAPPATKPNLSMQGPPTVYIAPMKGFETYLAAAMKKRPVNLVQVADPNKADYIISGNSDEIKPGWTRWRIQMMNTKSSMMVFTYAVNKKYTLQGQQTAAEACAKHLEAMLEGWE